MLNKTGYILYFNTTVFKNWFYPNLVSFFDKDQNDYRGKQTSGLAKYSVFCLKYGWNADIWQVHNLKWFVCLFYRFPFLIWSVLTPINLISSKHQYQATFDYNEVSDTHQ